MAPRSISLDRSQNVHHLLSLGRHRTQPFERVSNPDSTQLRKCPWERHVVYSQGRTRHRNNVVVAGSQLVIDRCSAELLGVVSIFTLRGFAFSLSGMITLSTPLS